MSLDDKSMLEKSLLDVERKHGISLEQADWEMRGPQTEVEIHPIDKYAAIPLSIIEEKWGFIPSTTNMVENEVMHEQLRVLAHLLADSGRIPEEDVEVVVTDECVLMFW